VDVLEDFDDRNGLFPVQMRRRLAKDLERYDDAVRPGLLFGAGAAVQRDASRSAVNGSTSAAQAVERVRRDLRTFKRKNRLSRVVVVNVASTESTPKTMPAALRSAAAFEKMLRAGRASRIPSSVLYAWAAVEEGMPYVNFTPSLGGGVPAVRERALERGVPHTGRDGKTGETLLKTVLAPMFVARRLRVLSWEGYNMLGNRDGEVLDDPAARRSKVTDKDAALRRILRDPDTHTRVSIDYVPSLDDWKTAFDFVHFQGFLGARMTLQFTWQGCDSALAAPLVLDLARLTDLAHRRGETGTLPWLAPFFKGPLDGGEQDFAAQHMSLMDWVRAASVKPATASR
ncbi:MAG: inositol-3-phosphate synthase, partial [Planctomycetota bacterium]|jgi:myo-inositol-1-phosphate synthase